MNKAPERKARALFVLYTAQDYLQKRSLCDPVRVRELLFSTSRFIILIL